MENQQQHNARHRYYKLLQVGKRTLQMDDDAYRALLARHGAKTVDGHVSATTLHFGALVAAVEEMKRKGFRPQAKTGSAANVVDWRQARVRKIIALWCALADAGVVHNRSEAAMVKWCARITRKARLQWATSPDLNACIEALKDWARRERVKIDD